MDKGELQGMSVELWARDRKWLGLIAEHTLRFEFAAMVTVASASICVSPFVHFYVGDMINHRPSSGRSGAFPAHVIWPCRVIIRQAAIRFPVEQ
jgi:hypothetical protein